MNKKEGRAEEVPPFSFCRQMVTDPAADPDELARLAEAVTPEQLREFAEFVKEEHPDIYKALFSEEYDK